MRTGRRSAPGPVTVVPLVTATMASQGLLVVLAPTIVAVGRELGTPVGAVAQARSITAVAAIVTSVAVTARVDSVGVPRLLGVGAGIAVVACAAVAAAPTFAVFLAAHVLVGLAFACLLSAGFAGVAAFPPARRAWAMGRVAAANGLAWVTVTPVVGMLTGWASWRVAQVAPAAVAVATLLTARSAAPVPAAGTAPRLHLLREAVSARR